MGWVPKIFCLEMPATIFDLCFTISTGYILSSWFFISRDPRFISIKRWICCAHGRRFGGQCLALSSQNLTNLYGRTTDSSFGRSHPFEQMGSGMCSVKLISACENNLNPHTISLLYETFSSDQALSLEKRLEIYYTPELVNMAEIELNSMTSQCLNRCIGSIE